MNLVPKPEWGKYLDRVSRGMVGLRAEIEVASLELGDQIRGKADGKRRKRLFEHDPHHLPVAGH